MMERLLKLFGVYKLYENRLKASIMKGRIPGHIGIILDGNRRWAVMKGLEANYGHEEGANRVEELLDWCHELGVKTVTLYVLSTENLKREPKELSHLISLIEKRLEKLLKDERIYRYGIKVKAIGKIELLPETISSLVKEIEKRTETHESHYLNIALAYGGRSEIADAMRSLALDVKSGKINPEQIDEELVAERLYTAYLPNQEPDLIIRTSGEERMSGFMLWQAAYSELVFIDAFWPDFRFIDLMRAIRTYQKRVRRYGL
jgi:tritrans,polycis-undecaprenyl-diphosphate synthase [geranylgeranyl-diphosphate specific]